MFSNKELNRIEKEIMDACSKVLESRLNELSSTTYDDAAAQADKYFNSKLAQRFREAGKEARQREKETEYDKTLQIIDDIEANGKQFYVAKYIPTNIKVFIYLNKENQCAIARIKNNELVNIKQKDILSDISHIFNNREAVQGDAVKSISKALKQGRWVAKEVVERINSAVGSNISWRYFVGDKTNNITGIRDTYYIRKDAGTLTDDMQLKEYQYSVVQFDTKSEDYSIYYVMIGSDDFSFMMHIKTKEKGTDVEGANIITTPHRVMRSYGDCEKCPVPTVQSSDIAAIYDFFMNNKKIGQTLINAINTSFDFSYMSLNDVQKGYDKKYNSGKVSDKAEFVKNQNASQNDAQDNEESDNGQNITDDQMSSFM